MRHSFLIALFSAGLSVTIMAGTQSARIDQRQANQQARIAAGEQSGALTQHEATRLKARQGRIAAREAAMKADGQLNRHERAKLQHALQGQSRAIKHQKRDRQRS